MFNLKDEMIARTYYMMGGMKVNDFSDMFTFFTQKVGITSESYLDLPFDERIRIYRTYLQECGGQGEHGRS